MGFVGEDLSKLLLNKLIEIGLNIQYCRGLVYDGAGAVSGYINGLFAHVSKYLRVHSSI